MHKGLERLSFVIELEPDIIVNKADEGVYGVKFTSRVDENTVAMVDEEVIRIHKTGFV